MDVTTPAELAGLTQALAEARLEEEGPNRLPDRDRRSFGAILLEVLREPMFALLLAAGAVYLALGDPKEAWLLMVFACLSISISVAQQLRSERVLAAMRDLAAPVSTVMRDGKRLRLSSTLLVRGDIVEIAEGQRAPADGLLRQGDEIEVDESLLTGESVPVRKRATLGTPAPAAPGGDDTPFVFAGSLVVRGLGLAEVTATGPRSALGKLGHALESIVSQPSKLVRETRRLVRLVGAVGFAVCLAVVVLFGLSREGWLNGVLAGVALGMAMLPEEFPLVLSVFMVMGTWRLSRAKVLTRQASAIEALGAATVLCTDKTGTLTQNRMRLAAAWTPEGLGEWGTGEPLPASARPLARAGLMASAVHPFDPMEQAFHDACAGWDAPAGERTLEKAFGLSRELMAVSQVWAEPGRAPRYIAAKGAPEAIIRLCALAPGEAAKVLSAVERMAAQGMRVLGVAEGFAPASWTPAAGAPLNLLGLLGLADPLRPDAAAAVAQCRAAGVRVAMITGDYPATALAIARQLGIQAGRAVTGAELDRLTDAELAGRIGEARVFARILPEQKLRIVRALQAAGEVVAMTGDGVNDAPALKAADIGIAMGGRGADVARAAADLILLNDDFASIVGAMRLGRRIYDNLQKAMGFILAVHVPIAGLALAPLLLGLPVFLAPAQIAFLEMVIDPLCSIAFEMEPEEAGVMRRPPRAPDTPLLPRRRMVEGLGQGLLALAAGGGVYAFTLWEGLGMDAVRTVTFLALVLSVFALVIASRSFGSVVGALLRPNLPLALILAGALGAVALVVGLPPLRALFHFALIGPADVAVAVGAAGAALLGLDLLRRAANGKGRPPALRIVE